MENLAFRGGCGEADSDDVDVDPELDADEASSGEADEVGTALRRCKLTVRLQPLLVSLYSRSILPVYLLSSSLASSPSPPPLLTSAPFDHADHTVFS